MENYIDFVKVVCTVPGTIVALISILNVMRRTAPESLMGIQSYKMKVSYKYKKYIVGMLAFAILPIIAAFYNISEIMNDKFKVGTIYFFLFLYILQILSIFLCTIDKIVERFVDRILDFIIIMDVLAAFLAGVVYSALFKGDYLKLLLLIVLELVVIMPAFVKITPWLRDYEKIAKFLCVKGNSNFYIYYDDEKGNYICGDEERCELNNRFYIIPYKDVDYIEKISPVNTERTLAEETRNSSKDVTCEVVEFDDSNIKIDIHINKSESK